MIGLRLIVGRCRVGWRGSLLRLELLVAVSRCPWSSEFVMGGG